MAQVHQQVAKLVKELPLLSCCGNQLENLSVDQVGILSILGISSC